MSLREIIGPVKQWDAEGRRTCIALLFKVEGSSPRPPGSRLAINERGDMAGFISLGCVEGDVREHVRQILAGGPPRILHYGVADEASLAVGLSCGGQIDVLLTPHVPTDAAWQAVAAGDRQGPEWLMTRISSPDAGRQLLRERDGTRSGTLGGPALDEEASKAIGGMGESGGSRLLDLSAGVRVFVERLPPPFRLALVGATPVAGSLCKLAAAMGMEVTVMDPRRDFANPQLFPGARRIVLRWPEEGFAEAGVDRDWLVAVVSHDPKLDLPGLASALRAGCRYIGLLGGRKTQEQRREALADQGFSPDDLARLHGPIGLRIGSVTPDEIAVSILAEIISLSGSKSPSAGATREEAHA